MKKLLLMFMFFMLFVVCSINAQTRTIRGKIIDETGASTPGVNIIEKGTSNGTTSDVNGNYSIAVSDGATLVFSFIGYSSIEMAVGTNTTLDVTMKPDVSELAEVVVVGYGSVRKSDLTGAVSSIKGSDLKVVGAIGLDMALAGRAPGVVVTSSSGQPGGGAAIRIRAVSSLNGSDPLYVIDGIPLDNTSAGGLGNQDMSSQSISPLSMINPADIESMEILKDASSTAIYGSRGANGVVLITTKKGKSGKGVVTIDQEFGVTQIPKFIDVLDANDYYILNREAWTNVGTISTPEEEIRLDSARAGLLPSSNWQETIIHNGVQSSTNVTFSGGNDAVRFLIGSNFLDSKGIVESTDYRRIANRVNLDANLSPKFKAGVTINYSFVKSNQSSINTGVNNLRGATSAISRALAAAPTTGIDADDQDAGVELWTPVTALDANRYKNLLTQFIGSLYGEYALTNELAFRTVFSFQNAYTTQRYYQFNILPNNVAEGGRAKTGDVRDTRATWTNTLSYAKVFGQHDVNVLLGQSIESTENEGIYVSNYGFANDLLTYYNPSGATFFDPDNVSYSNNNLASFFGRVNYNFQNKYLFTLTGRFDGSSKFAENNKWAFFPAAAFAYKLSEEAFLKSVNAISELKLRVSYGTSGNQAISPYQSLDQYGSGLTPFNEATTSIYYASQLPNANLSWETTTTLDIGLDFGILGDKITGTFEYYNKETDDLLFAGNAIPAQSGFNTYTKNLGTLETNGIEVAVNAFIISSPKFSWTLNANMSTGKTKVTSMASDNLFSGWNPGYISGGTQRLIIGEEIGAFYGYKRSGIAQFSDFVEFQGLTEQEQIDQYNATPNATYTFVDDFDGGVPWTANTGRPGEQLYEDDGDGVISALDRKIIGYAQPDVIFSINNTFKIGNIDISVFVDSQQGKDVANIPNMGLLSFNQAQGLTEKINRWTPENQSTEWPRVQQGISTTTFSDRYVEDGSFVRLQNITVGYNFPRGLTEKLKMTGLRIYVSGSNLAMWTKYTGYTPDVSLLGSSTTSLGHDNGGYPAARLIRGGVNIKF